MCCFETISRVETSGFESASIIWALSGSRICTYCDPRTAISGIDCDACRLGETRISRQTASPKYSECPPQVALVAGIRSSKVLPWPGARPKFPPMIQDYCTKPIQTSIPIPKPSSLNSPQTSRQCLLVDPCDRPTAMELPDPRISLVGKDSG